MNTMCGTWQLTSFYIESCVTKARKPYFSEHPTGILVYDSAGNFTAQIAGSSRPTFATNDPYGGTDAETVACYRTYLAYFGKYEVDMESGTVKHHVEASLYPTWKNSTQVRSFAFSDADTILTLSTPPIHVEGQDVVSKLEWKRVV